MGAMTDEQLSDQLDRLLAENPDAGEFATGRPDVRLIVEVALDGPTLDALSARARREGRELEDVIEDVLRAATT